MTGGVALGAVARSPYLPGAGRPEAPGHGSRLRLFCFHHAGGAASTFSDWAAALGPQITVQPVQLPGRERRVSEGCFTDMEELVRDLNEHLDPYLAEPYAFYGHSMGAIVAYCFARYRAARGLSQPDTLAVGSYPAPHLPNSIARTIGLPQDRLARWLIEMGGMAPVLLSYPQWLHAATELFRDDLKVCHSHRYASGEPLNCPIHVFYGDSDPVLAAEAAQAWERHTVTQCRVHAMPGGHFFQTDNPARFFAVLSSVLTRYAAARV